MKSKIVLVIADLHCGNIVGLTPPDYMISYNQRINDYQNLLWNTYRNMLRKIYEEFGYPHILISNGDLIDGKQARGTGNQLITSDINKQIDMTLECINEIALHKDCKIAMTRGTRYHVGQDTDYEDQIAKLLRADQIVNHGFFEVNGLILDVKHKLSSSTVPHGRGTPLFKEKLWNIMWNYQKESPNSDIIIRSHTHYHTFVGDPSYLALSTPALQGLGDDYGTRDCSGVVHFGLTVFEVFEDGTYRWKCYVEKTVNEKTFIKKL